MPHHGESGRIVVDVETELKRQLYASLSLAGSTLKEWFIKSATEFCAERSQLNVHRELGQGSHNPMITQPNLDTSRPSKKVTPPLKNGKGKLSKKLSIVSMFSGCGGMDLGFKGGFEVFGRHYDNLPFEIVWANDLNEKACATYRRNLGGDIRCGDVWNLIDSMPKAADIVVGGFPCQDISVNGKRAGVNGARSGLYKAMVEAVRKVKPKVFVAENVKGLLMGKNHAWLEQVLSDFRNLGYTVHHQLYKAADYGVPQTRERVIFVGTANGVRPFVPPLGERTVGSWMTAKEAIGDLESRKEDPTFNHVWSLAKISPEQGNRRLTPTRPAYTIRAECHGNIQFHYRLQRRISMREAARFQSFPDSFVFESKIRETERQVGNAVPPVFAWHVAKAVLRCVE